MRDKITVYGLLSKIYNENKDIFKKIGYDEEIWEYDRDVGDYYSKITNKRLFATYFGEMEAKVFLQDEVDIIQDNKIEKADYQTSQIPPWFRNEELIGVINNNFELQTKAIRLLIDEINKLKENK